MLTETDDRVRAAVNLHAVFGALPRLVELVPAARDLLGSLRSPVGLTIAVRGLDPLHLLFERGEIRPGRSGAAVHARLILRSAEHLNRVVDGTSRPLPLAGPAGLRFLTAIFTPLTELLTRYLQPSAEDVRDEVFAEASGLMMLDVAVSAIAVLAAEDRSGRFSAAHMPDGDLDIAIRDGVQYRMRVRGHHVSRIPPSSANARAVFQFADVRTASAVLAGTESALACVGDGRIALSGYIPLIDNTSRILDRVGHYLGKAGPR